MSAPAIIAPTGRVDGTVAPALEAELLGALEGGVPALIVDLGGVDYISSAGLRVFLIAAKAAQRKGRKLALAGARGVVADTLGLGGFEEIIPTYPSIGEAVAAIR